MTQAAKIVDLTRSFLVTDPNAFPENMMIPKQEDSPEQSLPILGFEGYNFLPTSYGYRSFFGDNATLDITTLTSRCDDVFLYQFANYQNILVALCEDGIWVALPAISGNAWVHSISLSVPSVGTYKQWTHCLIENVLYMYRQGESLVYKITPTAIAANVVTVSSIAPTFLNLAGQMGIFRANGRLGFWDSANSVSWSNLFDLSDFIPTAETLAGNCIFNGVIGRIVNILPQGDGYVIYTTKGIVGVRYSATANILWDASSITDVAGIFHPKQVSRGLTELEHFVFTNTGIKRIGAFNALNRSHAIEDVLTDVYDFLKESRDVVRLDLMNGRYLCFSIITSNYIDGKTSFTFNTVNSLPVRILVNDSSWDGINILPAFISGLSVEEHISQQMQLGAIEGMYLQWNGTGEAMVPSRNPSAIKPYNIDSFSNHIDNVGISLSSKLTSMQVQSLVSEGTYTDEETTVYPFGLALGWTYPGLGNVGSAYKGLVDGYLSEFIATQVEEWNGFITIQAATKIALDNATPEVISSIVGNTPYDSSSLAQAAITLALAVDLASHPTGTITGNTFTYTEIVGNFLSGEGTTLPAVLTGVGTNYAQYSLTRNLTGGWDIVRTIVKEYSIRPELLSPTLHYKYRQSWLWGNYLPITTRVVETIGTDLAATKAQNYADIYAQLQPDPTYGSYAGLGLVPTDMDLVGTHYFYIGATPSINNWITADYSYTTFYPTEHYIDYTVTHAISTIVNGGLEDTSTVSAGQENLTWRYFAEGLPVGNYTTSYGSFSIPGTNIPGTSLLPLDLNITYPGSSFLIQNGSIGPIYPTYSGALVLDLGLKKWGKLKNSFKALVDYSPINSASQPVTFTNFGIDMGMLNSSGNLKLFDAIPVDSWIRYGKLGYYRLGMTQAHEIIVHFRKSSSGTITLDSSLDGRSLELTLQQIWYFSSVANTTVLADQVGRWHTIKISGQFDLSFLEFRGTITGRR